MAIFLSRLRLNLHRREVQHDLADCQALHRRVLSAFPQALGMGTARDQFGVLYRIEAEHDRVALIVQSTTEPHWTWLPAVYVTGAPDVKRIESLVERITPGLPLRFRLVANPTRRISSGNGDELAVWHGKRVAILGEAHQLAWLARKGEMCGFSLSPTPLSPIVDVRISPQAMAGGQRKGEKRVTLGAVRFDGRLRVTDGDRLRQALVEGIGSGKAFGMGLLSIAPDIQQL